MLNDITIMGRLTRDPELRFTQSGTPVASFTVAVERDYAQNGEKATDFIDCVAWRQSGEFVSRYFCKGDMICVSGRLESRRWQDRDGNNRVSWEINTAHSYFCGSKRDNQGGAGQPPYRQAASGSTLPPQGEARDWRPARDGGVNVYPEQGFRELDEDDGDNPFENRQRAFEQDSGEQTDVFDNELPF